MSNEPGETAQTLTGYCAYLVRLWQDSPYGAWRASAQSVQNGETVRFATIEQLFAFLQAQTASPVDNTPAPIPNDPQAIKRE